MINNNMIKRISTLLLVVFDGCKLTFLGTYIGLLAPLSFTIIIVSNFIENIIL